MMNKGKTWRMKMDTPKADKVILENSKAGLPCVLVEVRGVQ